MAEIKQGFKQTDIGVIPVDWDVPNITENSTLKARIGWQGLTTAEYLTSGDYFLVTGTDISKGRVNWDSCFYVDLFRYNQDRNIQLRNDDILITKDGTIGKVAYVDNLRLPATLNSGVFVIRPKNNDYYPQFLFYIFNSRYFHLFLDKLVAGSTINHLYQKDFVTFKFPLPKPKEQEAIATVLSDIDLLIDELTKLIEKKRAIKEGAMQQLLSPKEGWIKTKLGDLAKGIISGKSNVSINGTYPVYGSMGIIGHNNKFTHNGVFLLIARVGANAGTINLVSGRFSVTDNTLIVDLIDSVDSKYIYYTLKLSNLNRLVFGTGQPLITGGQLKDLSISTPLLLEEQQQVASTLSDMDNEIEALEQNLSKYKAIKTGMMQQLLTGQIRLI